MRPVRKDEMGVYARAEVVVDAAADEVVVVAAVVVVDDDEEWTGEGPYSRIFSDSWNFSAALAMLLAMRPKVRQMRGLALKVRPASLPARATRA